MWFYYSDNDDVYAADVDAANIRYAEAKHLFALVKGWLQTYPDRCTWAVDDLLDDIIEGSGMELDDDWDTVNKLRNFCVHLFAFCFLLLVMLALLGIKPPNQLRALDEEVADVVVDVEEEVADEQFEDRAEGEEEDVEFRR